MSCRKRLTARLVGSVFVALLGSGCAEFGMSPFALTSASPQQASIVDHALNAAKAARAAGDLNGAAAKLAYLVGIAPDNVGVLAEYAKVLTELGRPDDALAYFQRAKVRDPNDWKLLNAEGVAYDEKHDFAAASDDYTAALKLSPGEGVVINNAARSRMAAGDFKGAEALLAQANPEDRAKGYLADTQSHLTALKVAQNSNSPAASLAPQALDKTVVASATATSAQMPQSDAAPEAPAPVAPVAVNAGTMPAAAPVSASTQEVQAVPVAMNTTSSWTPPKTPATAPTVIDASTATPPAPAADTKPAARSAPPVVSAATTSQDSVLPSLVPAKEDAKPAAAPASVANQAAPSAQADNHRYYIRVGTYRSRRHARHVAARLRPRSVHMVRLTLRGRRYYRVWIANTDRVDAEAMLPSVHALGYRHAHILAKLDSMHRIAHVQGTCQIGCVTAGAQMEARLAPAVVRPQAQPGAP